jgi:hypothetical protein
MPASIIPCFREFRTRLVALTAEERFLEVVLDLCKERGWLKTRGRQRTDSTHVLAKIRALNRAECVVETLRHALNVLSVVTPDWLRSQVQPEWLERYGHRAEEYRFPLFSLKRTEKSLQKTSNCLILLLSLFPATNQCLSIRLSLRCIAPFPSQRSAVKSKQPYHPKLTMIWMKWSKRRRLCA